VEDFAQVVFEVGEGRQAELRPGDLIGRSERAALCIGDPRVSEAHALVSFRRGDLYLLALRRLVSLAGKPVSEVRLREGTTIELCDTVQLRVERVILPSEVWGLSHKTLGTFALSEVTSLIEGPPAQRLARFAPDADAHVWCEGPATWFVRCAREKARKVALGDDLRVGSESFRVVRTPLAGHSVASTDADERLEAPLTLVLHTDTVEIQGARQPAFTLSGLSASLVATLARASAPIAWNTLVLALWHDTMDPHDLRHRLDVALGRLRTRLREGGVRADLVSSVGGGQLQLALYPTDRVVDRRSP